MLHRTATRYPVEYRSIHDSHLLPSALNSFLLDDSGPRHHGWANSLNRRRFARAHAGFVAGLQLNDRFPRFDALWPARVSERPEETPPSPDEIPPRLL